MERFIRRQNIAHYRYLLSQHPDEPTREVLRQLLAEEEEKLQRAEVQLRAG